MISSKLSDALDAFILKHGAEGFSARDLSARGDQPVVIHLQEELRQDIADVHGGREAA